MTARRNDCPGCGSMNIEPFYEVLNVPVHSCLMMSTIEEAEKFPRGDVVLGFCGNCGFIFNTAFDSSHSSYSAIYEDQQSYSPTFNAFAKRLARDLINKFELRNKNLVEIGCGKGDFLALMCELGDNSGVGIDPTCVKERIRGAVANRITVIDDYYSEKYSGYTGDFVMCRHTLEHIPETSEFLSTLRKGIGGKLETNVFFEIPETVRVLREAAFWDIYYEHCSYFTPGSLGRLFRYCGFDVEEIYLDYNGQYLLLDARPAPVKPEREHPLEESIESLKKDVDSFRARIKGVLESWRLKFDGYRGNSKKVAIWGSGSKCVSFLTTLGIEDIDLRVVDINPNRHGKYIPGAAMQVFSPESLRDFNPDTVMVMNPVYEDEIRGMLADMKLKPEVYSV
ncbi:MAG: methyltransferase domain-containing protein [candidate division Zixibacteria bacterium]|nr:methyltransferase domain-containing protein [candidate division Zixibacteria bacterium]